MKWFLIFVLIILIVGAEIGYHIFSSNPILVLVVVLVLFILFILMVIYVRKTETERRETVKLIMRGEDYYTELRKKRGEKE